MNFEKTPLLDLVKTGRSLVLCQTKEMVGALGSTMCVADPLLCVVMLTNPEKARDAVDSLRDNVAPTIFLAEVRSFAHGWRGQFDRVIWIGKVPAPTYSREYVIYEQAMARGDMKWGHPAKWHYHEDEIFSI